MVTALGELVQAYRTHPRANPKEYIACWRERDRLDGEVVDAFVLVLRTRGCYWAWVSGCTMCGYVNDTTDVVTQDDVRLQFRSALERYNGERIAKVYTSGNFFDKNEVGEEARAEILTELGSRCDKVIVEALPQLVKEKFVREGVERCRTFEVAIGLESANDAVLRHSVNKDFTFADFGAAADLIHSLGGKVKTYLLVKPPFLTERAAIEDAVASARRAAPYSDTISFNPVNVPNHTVVERLWKRGAFRPPWLWSVGEVLQRTKDLGVRTMCFPTGGGSRRGAHNCGSCDGTVLREIEAFSLGLPHDFDALSCACQDRWRDLCEMEPFFQSAADIEALLTAKPF